MVQDPYLSVSPDKHPVRKIVYSPDIKLFNTKIEKNKEKEKEKE